MKLPSGQSRAGNREDSAGSSGASLSAVEMVQAALSGLRQRYRTPAAAAYVLADPGEYVRWVEVGDGMPERWADDAPSIRVNGGLIALAGGAEVGGERDTAVQLIETLLRNRQLELELQHRRFQSGLDDVRLQSLYDVGLAIASTLEEGELIDEILLRAVALLDARRGALLLYRDGRLRLAGSVGGDAVEQLDVVPGDLHNLTDDYSADDLLPGAGYVLAHPIEADLRRLGVLMVGDRESRKGVGPFDDSDSPTLGLFASQAAIALENARLHREALAKERLEREMELASEIQQRLLPRSLPRLDGFEFAAWSRSARHVGGDYHDLIPTAPDRVALVLGDVSGKGVPASLLVSTVYSALRLLLEQCGVAEDLLSRLNDHLAASSASNKFVTFFVAEVSTEGEVRFGNAGHNPALVVSPDGTTRLLESGGMPLGMIEGAAYSTDELSMASGDVLCIYSDGITEAENEAGEEFGLQRLIDVVSSASKEAPSSLVGTIREAVEEFSGSVPQGDDQTLVVARRQG